MSGVWCWCAEKLLPVGATAVWLDGRMHREDVCFNDPEWAAS